MFESFLECLHVQIRISRSLSMVTQLVLTSESGSSPGRMVLSVALLMVFPKIYSIGTGSSGLYELSWCALPAINWLARPPADRLDEL